jgi:protocatechuate 3,4-dioxygenase beta subunit
MSSEKQVERSMSRRHFIRLSTSATAGMLLAGCAADELPGPEITPAEAVAQNPPTPSPTTPAPTATLTAQPPATAAPTAEPTLLPTNTPTLPPTPQCDDHDETPAQTAGPFYTPNTPERTSLLEEGLTGPILVVSGRVLTPNCEPIAGAILDFWHADNNGQYDNVGYRLRGHQFTDASGAYRLETIVPGLYTGRTRHIHVIVQGPTTSQLTTQLYFPNEPSNQNDGIFRPELVMTVQQTGDDQTAAFDFVLV